MTEHKRVALVSGGTRGIGRNIALTLARQGHQLAINFKSNPNAADALLQAIRDSGGEALGVQADITTAEGCRKAVEVCQNQFGLPDICIIGPGGGWHPQPVDSLSAKDALQDLHDEVAPMYHLFPLVLPHMMEREWGRIIAIALHPRKASPAYAYDVAKAARTAAARRSEEALWKRGVTVNIVSPGPVQNPDSLKLAIELCDHGPAWIKRTTTCAQDVAEGVAFLCSDAGRFTTGTELVYSYR